MSKSLLIVSNRLPIVVRNEDDGNWTVKPGSGGLITALKPVLREYGGSWVGWPGDVENAPVDDLLDKVGEELGCNFIPVILPESLVEGFYYGFSNETIWPLFHDLLGHAKFEQEKWLAYIKSNRLFAEVLAESVKPDNLVWIHDYQLISVGRYLREYGVRNPLAYFLHIPFPPADIYARLPWRGELLRSFLAYGLLGFQSERDLRNFIQVVEQFVPEAEVTSGEEITKIQIGERIVFAGAFPISIDAADFERRASTQEVADRAWYIHESFREQQLVLGVDRLDYTKGIPAKFYAFERALEKYPELHNRISMVQLVVPSRQNVPEYAKWKDNLDLIVGRINGRFANRGWMPLHYMYRSIPQEELLGYYRAAEICLITPLKDGMNLVCKEYCASCVHDNGVLILSEFAGSAPQLKDGAVIVNPHDTEGVADAIYMAYKMDQSERQQRIQKLRKTIKSTDVFHWVKSYLDTAKNLAMHTTDQS